MNDIEVLLNTRYLETKELIEKLYRDESTYLSDNPSNPTLKATLFLVIYNLIESTIYTIFQTLFDEIAVNCSNFSDLQPSLQCQYKRYDKDNNINESTLMKLTLKEYSGRVTLFSGNLDAREIRTLLKSWGVAENFHMDGEIKLFDVKRYRNQLAHGERAFKEVGRNFSTREMEIYGESTHDYLVALVEVINNYVSKKGYMVVSNI